MLGQTISVILQCVYLDLYGLIECLCNRSSAHARQLTPEIDNKTATAANTR